MISANNSSKYILSQKTGKTIIWQIKWPKKVTLHYNLYKEKIEGFSPSKTFIARIWDYKLEIID